MALQEAVNRKRNAAIFVEQWTGRGAEKEDTASFWIELLRDVVGMKDVHTNVRFEEATKDRGYIDVTIRDAKTIIEQKSLGVPLDKTDIRQGTPVTPFEQAKRYADSLRNSERPDTIIVCDFDYFRIHDLDSENPAEEYITFRLSELPEQLYLLDFLIDPQQARRRREEQVSLAAGELLGELYTMLRQQYIDPDTPEAQHSLNVLCVRLVFLLFAEDAGVFRKDTFLNYLRQVPASMARTALKELFAYLDTPDAQRDPYAEAALKAFPYVNGGLFADQGVEIPNLSQAILDFLINEMSQGTDWSQISPTIFGGVFESTLNPETRRAGGMHYTSPQNIHRVIDPLFLDALKAELEEILTAEGVGDRKRRNQLEAFHNKIAGLTFFDPACGSGNFLTETYIHLRKLENKIISELQQHQGVLALDEHSPLKVSLNQFHGIEINDFAVNVATTAMWIAELQANGEAQTIVHGLVNDLPLTNSAHIVQGNALELDWAEVVSPEDCDYIIGNPPFVGARNQSKEQKAELATVFRGAKNAGNIDYVAGWFLKAAQYMGDHPIRSAFVATNSICQGEQVANVWAPMYDLGVRIDFAHDTFRWTNESKGQAAVFVIIVGFSKLGGETRLFHYPSVDSQPTLQHPSALNAYLKDAPDVFVWNRSKPLCEVPEMGIGNKPIDGGHYLFTPEEKEGFLATEPGAEPFFKRWYGSQEFIKGIERWVLWLGDTTPSELTKLPESLKRVQAVRELRLNSKSAPTQKLAATPTRFHVENMPDGESILVPEVSSENRHYIPLGFIGPDVFASNLVRLIPDATLYHFGVLHSRVHNAWMRIVAGRLEGRYRYSAGVVYNNFIWPSVSPEQEARIAELAQGVLDARARYPDATIAQMYKAEHDFLYPELMAAHSALDAAVEQAYGLEPGLDEQAIVAHLFALYDAAVNAGSA